MSHDVEFLRALLLYLAERQVSPRAAVPIGLAAEADDWGCEPHVIENGLNLLSSLDYIEGPGSASGGIWFFRKLTRKGLAFVRAARDPDAWEAVKRRQAGRSMPGR